MLELNLPSSTAILARPTIGLQFGVLPHESMILPLPKSVNPGQVAHVFALARGGIEFDELHQKLGYCGLKPEDARLMLSEMVQAKILRPSQAGVEFHVLASGVASERLEPVLEALGLRFRITSSPSEARRSLMVLPGAVFPTPDVQHALMVNRVAHYPAGIVDGRSVLGPLVVPGVTPCLACADSYYGQIDDGWRGVRLQATGRPGSTERHLIQAASTQLAMMVNEHVLPWWRAQREFIRMRRKARVQQEAPPEVPAIPEVLTQRRLVDFATGAAHTYQVPFDDNCLSCRAVRV